MILRDSSVEKVKCSQTVQELYGVEVNQTVFKGPMIEVLWF